MNRLTAKKIAMLRDALRRAMQHVPGNALKLLDAYKKPVAECRTLGYCERVMEATR